MYAIVSECYTFAPGCQSFGKSLCNPRVRLKEGLCCFAKGSSDPDSQNDSSRSKDGRDKVDWDKAWSSYQQQKKKPFLSSIDMEKYVTRQPQQKNYPLSEEVDPLKRTERATLTFWTDTKFTVAGFGVLIGLFIYMVVIVGAPPPK
ncbi:hypothetical protein KP509_01G125500 [Ceratopteris richardii]|uniref:Uncharacterized protein n=1 Tax=Ceratopteris richardii TaxID=49495 RepID=A0A8T2VQY0_CERRI|nr:hypothetical protein KP509_01G125500 [Ceratopteris richardii]